jgi:hypothetical protein
MEGSSVFGNVSMAFGLRVPPGPNVAWEQTYPRRSPWLAPTTGKVYHGDDIAGQNGPQIPNDRSLTIKRYNRFFRYD